MKSKIEISKDEHGVFWVRRPFAHRGFKTYGEAQRLAEELLAELGNEHVEISDRSGEVR